MKILLCEDDVDTAKALARLLRQQYAVDWAENCKKALFYVGVNEYDCIVLDLSLPDGNGLDLCKQWRSEGNSIPILIITGEDDTEVKVNALNSGADDYLTKPYKINELEARVRALLRRTPQAQQNQITVGELEIDCTRHTVRRSGRAIELRRKEFEILEYLALHAEEVIPRSLLFEHVWDSNTNPLSNTIDVHIKYLRDKVDKPFKYNMIVTKSGIGYRLTSQYGLDYNKVSK